MKRFPSTGEDFLRFLWAEKGFLLDGFNGSFQALVEKDARYPNQFFVRLEVSTKGEARKLLSDGLVLTLVFCIEPIASPGIKLPVDLQKVAQPTWTCLPSRLSHC